MGIQLEKNHSDVFRSEYLLKRGVRPSKDIFKARCQRKRYDFEGINDDRPGISEKRGELQPQQ